MFCQADISYVGNKTHSILRLSKQSNLSLWKRARNWINLSYSMYQDSNFKFPYQVHGGRWRGSLHAQVFRRCVVKLCRTFTETERRGVRLAQVQRGVSCRVSTSTPRPGLLAARAWALARAWSAVAIVVVARQGHWARLVWVRPVVRYSSCSEMGQLVVLLLVVLCRRIPCRAWAVSCPAVVTVDTLWGHRAAVTRPSWWRPRWQVLICRGQASDFERFCGLYEAGQLGLRYRGLPLVHEVNDTLDLPSSDVLEDDDWVFARVVGEDFLKVRAEMGWEQYLPFRVITTGRILRFLAISFVKVPALEVSHRYFT